MERVRQCFVRSPRESKRFAACELGMPQKKARKSLRKPNHDHIYVITSANTVSYGRLRCGRSETSDHTSVI
ncbi:hypothetical protein TNCV_1818971 [Trichonephila clavipes]|nr:hypothetical protein TNCV_1818971 [Trichonephila clavipes]